MSKIEELSEIYDDEYRPKRTIEELESFITGFENLNDLIDYIVKYDDSKIIFQSLNMLIVESGDKLEKVCFVGSVDRYFITSRDQYERSKV